MALSHAMEDQVLAASRQPLLITGFKRALPIIEAIVTDTRCQRTDQHMCWQHRNPIFTNSSDCYETVTNDALSHEWHLVMVDSSIPLGGLRGA